MISWPVLGKVLTLLSSSDKLYHYCSTTMALALNNPPTVDKQKKVKEKQSKQQIPVKHSFR